MQASVGWKPPSGALGALIHEARGRVESLRSQAADLKARAADASPRASFLAAIASGDSVQVIAEIKRRSPSKGEIAAGLDAGARALAYAEGGAAAISVLTEPSRFGGHIRDLVDARVCDLPLLRKDFIIDALQIWEAACYGASAVLLISRGLEPAKLLDLYAEARQVGLTPLVEIHTDVELAAAIDAGHDVIGVNNRNLETLEVSGTVGERLIPAIPRSAVAVYESGIASRDDVVRAAALGADAVLVGSALSASPDPAGAVRTLRGVAREARRAS